MTRSVVTGWLIAIVTLAMPAQAQDRFADVMDMPALRNAIRTDKKAFVATTLRLTDAQAKNFWPIYDAYQRSLELTNRRRVVALEGVIVRDRPITDAYAKKLANDLIANDEAELKARRTMQNRVMRAIPPSKAARYIQLESKIRAVQAYDIAAAIPLIR